jgi:hypothetical protein
LLEDIPQFKVLYESNKYPKGYFLTAVIKETPNNKVHPLNVTNSLIVFRECQEDPLQRFKARTLIFSSLNIFTLGLELGTVRKRAAQILYNLVFIVTEVVNLCE